METDTNARDIDAKIEGETVEYEPKVLALAKHLGTDPEEITEQRRDNTFSFGREEYLVMTDGEADTAWDEELERYIEECILPEIPERLQFYFDQDLWKRDARMDGRGILASYDGDENEIEIEGDTYYIYRVN